VLLEIASRLNQPEFLEKVPLRVKSLVKLKPDKFFMGKPSQNYGVSPKYCVTQFTCSTTQVSTAALTPAGEGWYSIYLPEGWKAELT